MASEDSTGTDENPAGTTDDSIAFTPTYSNRQYTGIGAAIDLKSVDDVSIGVDTSPAEGPDGIVSLHLRHESALINGRFFLAPEQADWLADQLHDHADAVRVAREDRDRDGEP
jgi:hypothetical protein